MLTGVHYVQIVFVDTIAREDVMLIMIQTHLPDILILSAFKRG